jgi:L-rhamnose mutarotase
MIRKSFMMSVYPGREAEYKARHNPIWADLEKTLKDHGVHTYTIFLNEETSQLFAYVEFKDEDSWEAIAKTPVCKRWWSYMRELMPSNSDNSPVSRSLQEVFHLEEF